jgi:hypothetical protein
LEKRKEKKRKTAANRNSKTPIWDW